MDETAQNNSQEPQVQEQSQMRAQEHQQYSYEVPKKSRWQSINESLGKAKVSMRTYLKECYRVLLVTKKPNREELTVITKVSGLGILLIGLIGFLIHLLREVLF